MLFLFHLGLESVAAVDTDPKERFISFKVSTYNESFLFEPLHGIVSENSWLEGAFFTDHKNIRKMKMR